MRWLDRLLVAILVLACTGVVTCAAVVIRAALVNRVIAALAANHDKPVSASARDELKFARADFLLRLDRLDAAQAWIDETSPSVASSHRVDLFYNLANARLRNAFVLIHRGEIDDAASNVRLAKDGYRQALAIDPRHWRAKYNLEVAMRLVRDFPQMEAEVLDVAPPEMPRRRWTDLPGQPRGLPR